MSGHISLKETDWMILKYLAEGTAVLQIGLGDGFDTAQLAETANLVIGLMPGFNRTAEEHDAWYHAWLDNANARDFANKVMALRADWPAAATQLSPRSFGLVFVHPPNVSEVRLGDVLVQAQRLSSTVAVTADNIPYRVADVVKACEVDGWSRVTSGGLWVLRYQAAVPDAPIEVS